MDGRKIAKAKFQLDKHDLIPKHIKLSEKEKEQLLKKYNISIKELPKIYKNDPALKNMDVKSGDVIKIIRKSSTAGEAVYCRGVINA